MNSIRDYEPVPTDFHMKRVLVHVSSKASLLALCRCIEHTRLYLHQAAETTLERHHWSTPYRKSDIHPVFRTHEWIATDVGTLSLHFGVYGRASYGDRYRTATVVC